MCVTPPHRGIICFATVTCQSAGESADSSGCCLPLRYPHQRSRYQTDSSAAAAAVAACLQDRMFPDENKTVRLWVCLCMCNNRRDLSALSNRQQPHSFQCCVLLWRCHSLAKTTSALQIFKINLSRLHRRHHALNRVHTYCDTVTQTSQNGVLIPEVIFRCAVTGTQVSAWCFCSS